MLFFYLSVISDPQQRTDFEQVYKDYHLACLHEALKFTNRNQMLAEDAVHNAVKKILTKYPEYLDNSCSKLKSSFVLIVRNEAIDLMRKEKIRSHEQLEDNVEAEAIEDISLTSIFEETETYESIMDCIKQLDDIYKLVFVHRYLDGMKNHEIAERLDISEKSVSVRLCRAKLRLKELLAKEGITGEEGKVR